VALFALLKFENVIPKWQSNAVIFIPIAVNAGSLADVRRAA